MRSYDRTKKMPEIKLYYNIDRPVIQRRTLYSGEGLTLSAMLLDAQCQPVNFEGGTAQLIIDDGTKTCKFWAWPARVDGETIAIDFDPAWVGAQKQLHCWFSFVAAGGGRVNRMPLILDIAYTPILDGTQLPPPDAAYATPEDLASEQAARQAADSELRAAITAAADAVQSEAAERQAGDKANADKVAEVDGKVDQVYALASTASSDAATAQRNAEAAQQSATQAKTKAEEVDGKVDQVYALASTASSDAATAQRTAEAAQQTATQAKTKAEEVDGSIASKIEQATSLFNGYMTYGEGMVAITANVIANQLQAQFVHASDIIFDGTYRVKVDDSDPGNLRLKVDYI